MEFNSIDTIKQCVKKGVGLSLLPKIAVEEEVRKKELAVLPWESGQVETAIIMIRHKDKWISPTLKVFIEAVRAVITPATG